MLAPITDRHTDRRRGVSLQVMCGEQCIPIPIREISILWASRYTLIHIAKLDGKIGNTAYICTSRWHRPWGRWCHTKQMTPIKDLFLATHTYTPTQKEREREHNSPPPKSMPQVTPSSLLNPIGFGVIPHQSRVQYSSNGKHGMLVYQAHEPTLPNP